MKQLIANVATVDLIGILVNKFIFSLKCHPPPPKKKIQTNKQKNKNLREMRMPRAATKSQFGKIYKSYIMTPAPPPRHNMWVTCELLLELVQVWLLHHHQKQADNRIHVGSFKY